MNNKIFIISGGKIADPTYLAHQIAQSGSNTVICCDGGTHHVLNAAIIPDVIIGDMDSIEHEVIEHFRILGTKIIEYPTQKDFTDTELALDYAMSLHPEEIFIWGALGGRIDHTLANIFLLHKGDSRKIRISLADEHCEVFLVEKESLLIHDAGKTVSLLALTPEATGITLSGFLYPLKKGVLKMGESRGISNIIQKERASIRLKSGKLLVVKYHRADFFPEAC
jgi:thiamine pyrophosphokinase